MSLRCPIVYKDIFTLNPLTVDMQAVDCRAALEAIQQSDSDFDANMVWESILPYHPLRFIQSNMDDLRIFESKPPEVTKRRWDFGGKIAVVAHIFYVDALHEFVDLAANIPGDFDFYVSTSSQQHKKRIEERLKSFNPGGRIEVRAVEQNSRPRYVLTFHYLPGRDAERRICLGSPASHQTYATNASGRSGNRSNGI